MPCAALLRKAIDDLGAARDSAGRDGCRALRFALSGLTKRNHLGIEDREWRRAAREAREARVERRPLNRSQTLPNAS